MNIAEMSTGGGARRTNFGNCAKRRHSTPSSSGAFLEKARQNRRARHEGIVIERPKKSLGQVLNISRFLTGYLRHLRFGPTILNDYVVNARKGWSVNRTGGRGEASSLSDNDSYTSIVELAAEERWHDFRSNVEYQDVLEHVSFALGSSYLAGLKHWPRFQRSCNSELAQKFSEIGNPPVWTFQIERRHVRLNTTFLRYLHVARLLEERFGTLTDLRICEIGIGFGGQASVIQDLYNPKSIALFDLPPVLHLAKRFHSEASPEGRFEYEDGRTPSAVTTDLLISNYAFSELQRSVQEAYLEQVVSKAPRGFMMWNLLSERQLGGITPAEFLKTIPNAKIEDEKPLSFKGNVLVTWGS